MNLLLTSGGIKNTSIRDAGRAPREALKRVDGRRDEHGELPKPLCDLGWKSVGVLELTALPTIQRESWVPMLRETDAPLVFGGDVLYLRHWMQADWRASSRRRPRPSTSA